VRIEPLRGRIADAAAASLDHRTDAIIQKTLQNELPADVTVLTVAHRLHTIMNADRVVSNLHADLKDFDLFAFRWYSRQVAL